MSKLFREEAVETQRERLWSEVILIQPFSLQPATVAVFVVVLAAPSSWYSVPTHGAFASLDTWNPTRNW